ncbi:serine protease [Clavibacter sp. VKM Ac-2872]|uniref:trypsin-like serine peptidase n=1 Tax=Clavibacter sp. VKM Ac-2872 TaxID=2783812 RepID=UPI00188BDD8E|nr:serine protease [Clavibacter sp. VKM Ac-2872]MBF4624577.1 serine protease [Clavibacter sp. VKM Ac-2872]
MIRPPHPSRHPLRIVIAGALLTGGVLVTLAAAPADAAPAHPPADAPSASAPTVVTVPSAQAAAAPAYWTPARKAAAIAASDGTAPDPAPEAASAAAAPISVAEKVAPVPHIGRLFYERDGHSYACSANVVRAGNLSTVATAAHCLTGGGTFSTNTVFSPGYEDDVSPYGDWPMVSGVIAGGYFADNGDEADDAAFLVVAHDGAGRGVQSVVGGSPVLFDQPLVQAGTVYGYPAQGRFDGYSLDRCRGTFQGLNTQQIVLDCDMREGVSGGPIFEGDDASGPQYADENARYTNEPKVLGPLWLANEHAAYTSAAAVAG